MADIGIKLGVEGERAFKEALRAINNELKVNTSELQLLSAKYDGNDKSAEALTETGKALENQLSKQQEKVEAVSEALENARNSFGETDARTLKWQESLNKAQTEVLKTEKAIAQNNDALEKLNSGADEAAASEQELKEAAAKAAREIEEQRKKVDEAKSTLLKYADAAEKKAAAALKALAVGSAAAVTAVSALVLSAGNAADELSDMSKVTGLSTTQLQVYSYTAKMAGTTLDNITSAQTKLTKAMGAAKDPTSATAKKFSELGVKVTDTTGHLRNADDVFVDTIDALGRIDNEAERDAAAMEIFGKSARELNPLILEGASGLKKYAEEAKSMGAIVSEDNVTALADMQGTVKQIGAQFDALKQNLAARFAPIAKNVLGKIQSIVQTVAKQLDSPKMKNAIDKLGKALQGFLEKTSSLASKLLPRLVDAVTFVIGNFDKLAISIGAVWAIFKGVQTVTNVAKAFSAVKTALDTLRVASAATEVTVGTMNTTMAATAATAAPVIAVIAALGVAVYAAKASADHYKETLKEMTRASDELSDEIASVVARESESRDAYGKTITEINFAKEKSGQYIKRLKELEGQGKLTNEQQEEYAGIVRRLKTLLPDLNVELNEQTGLLKDGADAIDDQIDALLKKAKASAYEERLTAAYKSQYELELKRNAAQENWYKTNKDYWSNIDRIKSERDELNRSHEDATLWAARMNMLDEEERKWNETMAAASKANNESYAAYMQSIAETETLEKQYREFAGVIEETTGVVEENTDGIKSENAVLDEHAQKIDALAEEHYKKIIDAATNMFDKIKTTTDLSMNDITETLKHNRKAIEDYEENLRIIEERGASENVMEYLNSLGIEQAGVIDLIAHSTDKQFKDFTKNFDKNVMSAEASATSWGLRVADGVANGITKGKEKVAGATRIMARAIEKAFTTYMDIKSPSRLMEKKALFVPGGAAKGIIKGIPDVIKATDAMSTAVERAFSIPQPTALTAMYGVRGTGGGQPGVGNTYNIYNNVSDPSPAFYDAFMKDVDKQFGGLYA